jgi:hypothetical protein
MAQLNLTRTFVNLLSTGAYVSGPTGRGRGESYSAPGEVRTYAGGRRRSIVMAGEIGSYEFTMLRLARVDVETLRSWVGQTVEVRDNLGRRFFGVYFAVDIIEYLDPRFNVAIKLTPVTYAEGV